MKRTFFLGIIFLFYSLAYAQMPEPPDKLYGQLFIDVQMSKIFPDSKTFADCVPKKDPKEIISEYLKAKNNPAIKFSLKNFVEENFDVPANPLDNFHADTTQSVREHINKLWGVLTRKPDKLVEGSSLIALPNSYIVPGGRFREIYYWDSYFTMLGLQESEQYSMMENMVNNFAWLINQYGHIPNGSRSYYLSRSQPPFFSMMVELLGEKRGNVVYAQYQKILQKEYDYWTDKTDDTKHAVKMADGSTLTRYWDQDVRPRQEAFNEDSAVAVNYNGDKKLLYKNLRSCAESGWDFSSRWFADGKSLNTIEVVNLIPVDLNGLLYHLELTLAKAYRETGNLLQENYYNQLAESRKKAINKYCYNAEDGWYYDYNISTKSLSTGMTIAGMSPFFFNMAPPERINKAAAIIKNRFLKPGGVLTTLKTSGQQWDAPNGWAPLQWLTIKGLENYNQPELARNIAERWIRLNNKVYKATGKLMEKYDVTDINKTAGGGEYPSQDGFGWTNGVLLKLMAMYNISE